MKPLVKIICCGAILGMVHSAIAAGANAEAASPSTAGVKAYPVKKMDRDRVEKRLEDKSAQTKARSERAKKSDQGQQAAPASK